MVLKRLEHSPDQLIGVVLDDGVGEQVLADLLDLLAGGRLAGLGQVDLDVLALPDVVDAGEAEARQSVLDGLALRVQDAVLSR